MSRVFIIFACFLAVQSIPIREFTGGTTVHLISKRQVAEGSAGKVSGCDGTSDDEGCSGDAEVIAQFSGDREKRKKDDNQASGSASGDGCDGTIDDEDCMVKGRNGKTRPKKRNFQETSAEGSTSAEGFVETSGEGSASAEGPTTRITNVKVPGCDGTSDDEDCEENASASDPGSGSGSGSGESSANL